MVLTPIGITFIELPLGSGPCHFPGCVPEKTSGIHREMASKKGHIGRMVESGGGCGGVHGVTRASNMI